MNPTNEQELRAILGEIPNYIFECLELSDEVKKEWKHGSKASDFGSHKQFVQMFSRRIQAHTNAEIAKVLDRLEAELNEQKKAAETNLAYHVDVTKNERLIRDWQGTVHGIEFCRPAIAAERAKLKEVK